MARSQHAISLFDDDALAPPRRRLIVIANPTAGGYRPTVLRSIVDGLRASGLDVTLHLTSHAGEIHEMCADPALFADTVIVAGGDGSLNEALRGLRDGGATPALAVIPFGTANVLAHELALPFDAEAIVEMIARGNIVPLHYGLAQGSPFVLMVSAGYDADVVHHVPLALKRRLGKLAYVWTALARAGKPRGGTLTIETDRGDIVTAKLAVVTNARRYGGKFSLCPDAHATQPGLHLVALHSDSALAMARFGIALLLDRIARARGVSILPVDKVTIRSDAPVACQIDGDPFGTTPITVEAARDPARIIVP